MDIDARIRRRHRGRSEQELVVDYDLLSPVSHIDEPVGRGPLAERLLDYVDPTFTGSLPPNGYLWGPKGAGKSAVVSVLFDRLSSLSLQPGSVIHTATRAQRTTAPQFVYVDARRADSRFALYRGLLDGLVEDSVPVEGVGTDWMYDRIHDALERQGRGAVVAVDHADEAETADGERLMRALEPFDDVAWLAVGRQEPDEVEADVSFRLDAYQDTVLVDVLMTRANVGLPGESLGHRLAQRIAQWAEGDAHDALAALLSAADHAVAAGHDRVREQDVTAGIDSVPRPCVSLDRIFTLSSNRQSVLRALVDLEPADRDSVTAAAEAIADADGIDLSAGTVKRFLYQLAELGVVERVPRENTSGKGRPPSRVEPKFPTRAFRRLYDTM